MKKQIVVPDPERVMEGLRDTGYEFPTAIADLVDNSIAAKADRVDIQVKMDFAGNIRVAIADDGEGMGEQRLLDAMRYGSPKRPDPASLGKFGLGLKTASTAFARRLAVTSRPDPKADCQCAVWDLDHVAKVREWELLLVDPEEEDLEHMANVAADSSGTVVTWSNVDRLLKDYQNPGGVHAQKALNRECDRLSQHLSMTYQRYLDTGDDRCRTIEMYLNGQRVEPWDPFCIGESELVAKQEMAVELEDNEATFEVKAFVLPRREEFANETRAKEARLSNDRQGIYIYRENRLIHDADWLGIYQKEPHGTLLRVEFSFGHRLDEAFHIDIKKSRIILNEDLWRWLADDFLPAPRRAADQRYREGRKKKVKELTETAHTGSNKNIKTKEQELHTADVTVVDPRSGEVEVQNKQGTVRLKLKLSSATNPGEVFVQAVDAIDDGMLWVPTLIDNHRGVQINRGHPYYHKVYVPNLNSGVLVQGMDSLLWALCAAELGNVSEATKRHFEDLRFEVSRLLRRLVEDLPEPDLDASDD